jgi:uncharacterized protein (TIGR03437 family)
VALVLGGNAVVANTDFGGDLLISELKPAPGPPRLVATCVTQAGAPYNPGPLAPGEIFSIYNAGFGPNQGVGAQPSGGKFPTEVGGVRVMIENVPVPLLYVSAVQINAVAPFLLAGRTAAHVKIVAPGGTSNEVVLGVSPAAPEIFLTDLVTAAILNQDGTVNSQSRPAHIGDFVSIFISGAGQTNPPGVDGAIPQAAGGTPLLSIGLQLNLVDAKVTYAGNAPGLISGLVQVNFQVPQFTHAGTGPPYQTTISLLVGGQFEAGLSTIWTE